MPTTAQFIYNEVAAIMMEPGGFQTGTVTNDMFFQALALTIQDLLCRTGMARDVFNIISVAGQSVYNEPCGLAEANYAAFADSYLFRDSGFSLDQTGTQWYNNPGQPFSWREDELPISQIQITPTPNIAGNFVGITSIGLGTISDAVQGDDFTVTSTNPGFGVISDASTGNVYLDPINDGFGTFFSFIPSVNNLQIVGNTIPTLVPANLSDYIPLVLDSFVPYLKYGVLEKLWATDSEIKDMSRAQYARSRYVEGIQASGIVLGEETQNAN